MTIARALHRYPNGRLYSCPCVTCQRETVHRHGSCLICKTSTVRPDQQRLTMMVRRAAGAKKSAKQAGRAIPPHANLPMAQARVRLRRDKAEAIRCAAEESRKKFETR